LRDAPARQQTIRATLKWSFELLDERERAAFVALGAFTGGADLETAERVTRAPLAVLDALVKKSLVRMRDGRLTMLEVVRQFAAATLSESAEHDPVRRRHGEWALELVEQLAPEVRIRGQGAALQRLDREIGNLRSALEWWLACGDGERSLRMATALQVYWEIRLAAPEGVRALNAALALGGPARERGRAHWARSTLSWGSRDPQRADGAVALDLAVASGDLAGQCMALDMLALLAGIAADNERAAELARRQRALADELGDPLLQAMAATRQAYAQPHLRTARPLVDEATVLLRRCGGVRYLSHLLIALVWIAVEDEEYDAAEAFAVEGLRAAEEAGDRFARMALLGNAGITALFLERMDVAEERFRAELEICRDERFSPAWRGDPLLGLAAIAARAGDNERAAMLAGASEAPRRELMDEADVAVYERLLARFISPVRAALGEPAWERAAATGAALASEQLFELADRRDRAASS
jgi:hypothetical protein